MNFDRSRLERILQSVRENPAEFRRFSSDEHQINPEARVISIANILERLELPANSTILDIGTGYGYGAVLLNALGYNVLGLEINGDKLREGLDYWKKLGIEFCQISEASSAFRTNGKLYFMARDARDLSDFPDNSIDMATAFYISGYMAGRNGAFAKIHRVLKPQKKLIITTEGPTTLPPLLRGAAVKVLSLVQKPEGLTGGKTFTINNQEVHDRHVVMYEKAA